MESTGIIKSVNKNIISNKFTVELELDGDVIGQLQKLARRPKLSIVIKNFTKKRSLDANAYFHVLIGKIADALHISNDRCKNLLIGRYGQYEYIDGQIPVYAIKSQYDEYIAERSDVHFKLIGYKFMGDEQYSKYAVMRGSHTYDTKEMSTLIDGAVEEARDLGIDTITPEELRQIKERWHI